MCRGKAFSTRRSCLTFPLFSANYAECFYQNLRVPDERARQRSRRGAARRERLYARQVRSGGGCGPAEHVQRPGYGGTKGPYQDVVYRRRSEEGVAESDFWIYGLHGAEKGKVGHRPV